MKYKTQTMISKIKPDECIHPVIIIGAGLNGLAAAHELQQRGIEPLILDGAGQPAEPWRKRHDGLRLNTHRLISHLPGMIIPKAYGSFPRRDDIVEYLQSYEQHFKIKVHRGVRVKRITQLTGHWILNTSSGDWKAEQVIIATGHERVKVIPDWPGRDGFTGDLFHAADFGSSSQYDGKSVLVVGAGNSGVDVLNHLAKANTSALWVSVRQGPTILPTRVFGIPLQILAPLMKSLPAKAVDFMMSATERLFLGNLKKYGLSQHPDGVATRLIQEGVAPAFDDGFVRALKAGQVNVLPEVKKFVGEEVIFEDGSSIRPDVVICATGYHPGLKEMVGGLDVLNDSGYPRQSGAVPCRNRYGLWFMGMKPRLPGVFYTSRFEAKALAQAVVMLHKEVTGTGKNTVKHRDIIKNVDFASSRRDSLTDGV